MSNDTRRFEYDGSEIIIRRPRNRDREYFRQLARKVQAPEVSDQTIGEYLTAVCYTVSGDEQLWDRPSRDAKPSVLLRGLEDWLDNVDALYTDRLMVSIWSASESKSAPPSPAVEQEADSDPNSEAPEPDGSRNS
jgi:hypothetical protein